MKKLAVQLKKGLLRKEVGFTLVELIIVVGIIVGLAAAIVPNVSRFSGKGDDGAKAAEVESVQAAMDTLMADEGITSVTGLAVGVDNSVSGWTALPVNGGVNSMFLDDYQRETATAFFYCYDGTGKITRQDTATTVC
jgi:type II secretory pathway pseudopilin PulG